MFLDPQTLTSFLPWIHIYTFHPRSISSLLVGTRLALFLPDNVFIRQIPRCSDCLWMGFLPISTHQFLLRQQNPWLAQGPHQWVMKLPGCLESGFWNRVKWTLCISSSRSMSKCRVCFINVNSSFLIFFFNSNVSVCIHTTYVCNFLCIHTTYVCNFLLLPFPWVLQNFLFKMLL